jgi:uncharacterized membrane-anchored protein
VSGRLLIVCVVLFVREIVRVLALGNVGSLVQGKNEVLYWLAILCTLGVESLDQLNQNISI